MSGDGRVIQRNTLGATAKGLGEGTPEPGWSAAQWPKGPPASTGPTVPGSSESGGEKRRLFYGAWQHVRKCKTAENLFQRPCNWRNCSGLRGAEWLMAEYGGWVTLGDESPKPPEKSGSWLKPIHLTKSELLRNWPAGSFIRATSCPFNPFVPRPSKDFRVRQSAYVSPH